MLVIMMYAVADQKLSIDGNNAVHALGVIAELIQSARISLLVSRNVQFLVLARYCCRIINTRYRKN